MHGLRTLSYLNAAASQRARDNAADPGHSRQRAAEERLTEALNHVADVLADVAAEIDAAELESVVRRARPPEWSVARHGDEYWVLPLTGQARALAEAIIPPRTRRYGMHYILPADDLVSQAVIESIEETNHA